MVLRVGIDKVARAFLEVNNNGILHTGYKFDSEKHSDLKEFIYFYRHLRASLRRRDQISSGQSQVATSDRPSSGDATLEKVTESIANDFLEATFEASRVGKHFWWALRHSSRMELVHEGYSLCRIL